MLDVDAIRKEIVTKALEEARQEIEKDLIAAKKDLNGTAIATFLASATCATIFAVLWGIFLMEVTLSLVP